MQVTGQTGLKLAERYFNSDRRLPASIFQHPTTFLLVLDGAYYMEIFEMFWSKIQDHKDMFVSTNFCIVSPDKVIHPDFNYPGFVFPSSISLIEILELLKNPRGYFYQDFFLQLYFFSTDGRILIDMDVEQDFFVIGTNDISIRERLLVSVKEHAIKSEYYFGDNYKEFIANSSIRNGPVEGYLDQFQHLFLNTLIISPAANDNS